MKNNPTFYRLVASMEGHRLNMDRELSDEMAADYDRRITTLRKRYSRVERYAYPVSVELERKGDFLSACVSSAAAVKAYLKGAEIATEGARKFPAHSKWRSILAERAAQLRQKAEACATADPQLERLLYRDGTRCA